MINMPQKPHIVSALLMLLASLGVSADLKGGLQIPTGGVTGALRETAMPELGGGRLASILTRYYQEGLGGPENWETISSLRVRGVLTLKDEEFGLQALQRKPNLIKMTITSNQRELVLGCDGVTAWKKAPDPDAKAGEMTDKEARRFKHTANFGNHLLYPFAEGKEIIYIDTVPMEGNICHQIRVTLDTGYQVDYFIDIRTYMEIKVVNTDLEDDSTRSVVFKDYIREHGMPIAKHVESSENGEWVSTLVLDEVRVNRGVMPWMFEMRD